MHNGHTYLCMLEIDKQEEGGHYLEKKSKIKYTIEREFISKISVQELLIRIIKSHINKESVKSDSI